MAFRKVPLAIVLFVSATNLLAQTAIKLPKNKYTPQQDVELGREAAAEVREQYPIIKDEKISAYLTKLGDRLVAVAPQEFKQPVFQYSFTPVNLKEINAFALPGGPMFVQRGMTTSPSACTSKLRALSCGTARRSQQVADDGNPWARIATRSATRGIIPWSREISTPHPPCISIIRSRFL